MKRILICLMTILALMLGTAVSSNAAAVTVQTGAVISDMSFTSGVPAGVVLCRSATYTAAAALDANSVIEMVPIPKGAMVLDVVLHVSALGVDRTVDVGDGDNVDRFFDGIVATSATNSSFLDDAASTALHYIYTAKDTIDAKILGGTFPIAAVVSVDVYYKMVDGFITDESDAFD
ncbi:MAG: hypothetical protein KKE73_10915 [Proteobacteria bacterium]|nr:hypothetical protein [Pseudomonadota bacterium]